MRSAADVVPRSNLRASGFSAPLYSATHVRVLRQSRTCRTPRVGAALMVLTLGLSIWKQELVPNIGHIRSGVAVRHAAVRNGAKLISGECSGVCGYRALGLGDRLHLVLPDAGEEEAVVARVLEQFLLNCGVRLSCIPPELGEHLEHEPASQGNRGLSSSVRTRRAGPSTEDVPCRLGLRCQLEV